MVREHARGGELRTGIRGAVGFDDAGMESGKAFPRK